MRETVRSRGGSYHNQSKLTTISTTRSDEALPGFQDSRDSGLGLPDLEELDVLSRRRRTVTQTKRTGMPAMDRRSGGGLGPSLWLAVGKAGLPRCGG